MKFATTAMLAVAMTLSAVPTQAVTNLLSNGSFELTRASAVFVDGVAQINGYNYTSLFFRA